VTALNARPEKDGPKKIKDWTLHDLKKKLEK